MANSSEKGRKISEAKRGVPQLDLGPDEVTLQQAVKETGYSRKILREGAEDQRLTHRIVERPGQQPNAIVFHLPTLRAEIAQTECSYPPCKKPAPSRSGHCGEHAAGVKYDAVELVCQYSNCPRGGEPFTRPGSWLREREGRGHYCSDECKGAAFAERRPGHLQTLNPEGARAYHRAIAAEVADAGFLDTNAAASRRHYSPSTIRALAGSGRLEAELRVFGGSVRLVYRVADVEGFVPLAMGAPRAGRVIACPGCGDERYRAPSHIRHERCWRCRLNNFERREHLARALAIRDLKRRGLYAALSPAEVEQLVRKTIGDELRGRPQADYYSTWLDQFEEARAWWTDQCDRGLLHDEEKTPGTSELHLDIAVQDYATHPERWAYDPALHRSRAAERVKKGLQRARAR